MRFRAPASAGVGAQRHPEPRAPGRALLGDRIPAVKAGLLPHQGESEAGAFAAAAVATLEALEQLLAPVGLDAGAVVVPAFVLALGQDRAAVRIEIGITVEIAVEVVTTPATEERVDVGVGLRCGCRRIEGRFPTNLETGVNFRASWSYRGARNAWPSTDEKPPVPPVYMLCV